MIKIILLLADNGERCESRFQGFVNRPTKHELALALEIKKVVDPLLNAEGCNEQLHTEYDREPIDGGQDAN